MKSDFEKLCGLTDPSKKENLEFIQKINRIHDEIYYHNDNIAELGHPYDFKVIDELNAELNIFIKAASDHQALTSIINNIFYAPIFPEILKEYNDFLIFKNPTIIEYMEQNEELVRKAIGYDYKTCVLIKDRDLYDKIQKELNESIRKNFKVYNLDQKEEALYALEEEMNKIPKNNRLNRDIFETIIGIIKDENANVDSIYVGTNQENIDRHYWNAFVRKGNKCYFKSGSSENILNLIDFDKVIGSRGCEKVSIEELK